jgi:hypothetical protein
MLRAEAACFGRKPHASGGSRMCGAEARVRRAAVRAWLILAAIPALTAAQAGARRGAMVAGCGGGKAWGPGARHGPRARRGGGGASGGGDVLGAEALW